jgi:hypothetical protein
MVGRMSRLAFAIIGLAVAVGAVASRAQSFVIDCPGTVQSLAVTNPELHCNCPNACVNCHPSCSQGSSASSRLQCFIEQLARTEPHSGAIG